MEAVIVPVKRHFQLLALVLIAVLSYGTLQYASRGRTTPADRLPEIYFYDKLDRRITLDHFKGKVVLVNLWANWCLPCVEELPALARLQEKQSGEPFVVLAIAMDKSSLRETRRFLDAKGAKNLEVYRDKDRQVPLRWKYEGLPTSFLLDRDGSVVKRYNGGHEWDREPIRRYLMNP